MTRDGTVGRSDATEGSLSSHWEVDPVRVMRPRFADSIRASSRVGLHPKAGAAGRHLRGAARDCDGCWSTVPAPICYGHWSPSSAWRGTTWSSDYFGHSSCRYATDFERRS